MVKALVDIYPELNLKEDRFYVNTRRLLLFSISFLLTSIMQKNSGRMLRTERDSLWSLQISKALIPW